MQAAIASLLELSLEHVPDFKSHESKWFEVMYKFISVGGYDFDGTLYNPKYLMFSSPDFYKDREAPESMLEEIKDMTGVKGYFFATVYSPKFFNEDIKEFIGHAVVIDKKQNVISRVSVGDSIVLHDMASGERLCYMVVSPTEVDPVKGKISSASPLGKAIVGRGQGEIIEVTVPAGKLRYQIKQIEH